MTKEKTKKKRTVPQIEIDLQDPNEMELVSECARQDGLYFKYASKLAAANWKIGELKSRRDVIIADRYKEMRTNPTKFGFDKITETGMKAALPNHKKWRVIVQKIRDEQYRIELFESMVRRMEHRKKTLENMVYLHGQKYFARPHPNDEDFQEEQLQKVRRKGQKTA